MCGFRGNPEDICSRCVLLSLTRTGHRPEADCGRLPRASTSQPAIIWDCKKANCQGDTCNGVSSLPCSVGQLSGHSVPTRSNAEECLAWAFCGTRVAPRRRVPILSPFNKHLMLSAISIDGRLLWNIVSRMKNLTGSKAWLQNLPRPKSRCWLR